MDLSIFWPTLKYMFNFVATYGYAPLQDQLLNEEEVKLIYGNEETGKEIHISLCNSPNTERLFIVIAIIRIHYKVVHDYVSFQVYLAKNKIEYPHSLEGNERSLQNVNSYLETYANLFNKYGIHLINTNEQFQNYFPERT